MSWAFIEYPWDAVLVSKQVLNVLPEYVRPDNGCGIILHNEEETIASSDRVAKNFSTPNMSFYEIGGPSFRNDGCKDISIKLTEEKDQLVLEYQDVSETDKDAPSARFHDALTNSLQELVSLLFDKRKMLFNRFHEEPLNNILRTYFSYIDTDFAHRSLICEIAEEMPSVIDEIVNQPRVVLQRKHRQVGLDRLQEMDMTSLVDYARRPGDTAVIKAGDRQRLLAVVREETSDTLENRVVKDFCKRACRWAELYAKESCEFCPNKICNEDNLDIQGECCSERVKRVESFARRCEQWLLSPTFCKVSSLQVPCRIPNYALLQNVRYIRVWDYYQRILNQEDVRDQTWQWKRKTWADYVRVLMMYVLSSLTVEDKKPSFVASRKPVRLRKNPVLGRWLKSEPFDGPFVFENNGNFVSVYLFNREDVDKVFKLKEPLQSLNADLYFVAVSTARPELRVIPIWSFVGDARWHSEQLTDLRQKCASDIEKAGNLWLRKCNAPGFPNIELNRLIVIKAVYTKPGSHYSDGKTTFIETTLNKDIKEFCKQIQSIIREAIS